MYVNYKTSTTYTMTKLAFIVTESAIIRYEDNRFLLKKIHLVLIHLLFSVGFRTFHPFLSPVCDFFAFAYDVFFQINRGHITTHWLEHAHSDTCTQTFSIIQQKISFMHIIPAELKSLYQHFFYLNYQHSYYLHEDDCVHLCTYYHNVSVVMPLALHLVYVEPGSLQGISLFH